MKCNVSKFKIILSMSVLSILVLSIIGCSSSEYICFKVKKSELMPDSFEVSRDSLIVGGLKIGSMAQRYYNKPTTMGGGGESFIGFFIPPYLQASEYGTYTATVGNQSLVITCKGKQIGVDGTNPAKVTITVTADNIVTVMNN